MDKERLIGLAYVREPIWNKENKNHHNCIILNKLWKEIAEECGISAASAKAQWKRLRQTFMKKFSEQPLKRSGDEAGDDNTKPEWPFFDSLLFLKDTCTPRTTEGNFSAADRMSSTERYYLSDDADDDENSSQAPPSVLESLPHSRTTSPMSPSTPVAKKTKIQKVAVGEALIGAEQEKIEYLKRKEENRKNRQLMIEENATRKEMDEDESFFNSILPHLKTFDPKTKMKFRINVLELVHNLMPTTINNTNVQQSVTGPHLTQLTIQQNLPQTSNQNSSQSSLSSQLTSTYLDHNTMDRKQQELSQNHYYVHPNTQFGGG